MKEQNWFSDLLGYRVQVNSMATNQRWSVTLARFSITAIWFCSLDTSLDIQTVILKVLIPVSISRLKIWESQFQSQYQDSGFKRLDSSLHLMTLVLNFQYLSNHWDWQWLQHYILSRYDMIFNSICPAFLLFHWSSGLLYSKGLEIYS